VADQDGPGAESQPGTVMTTGPEERRRPVSQLSPRELDLYGNQLERCLKALSTDAPIRAAVQRELAAVQAERQSRGQAGQPRQQSRPRDVSGLTAGELERTRRELAANLALVRPGSPARAPILAHIGAIDTELARRCDRGTAPSA
jgi:hypothetical protein